MPNNMVASRQHSYPKYLLNISKSMVAFPSFLPLPLTSTPSCSLAPPPFLATYSSVNTAILAMVSLCSALFLLLSPWFLNSLPCNPSSLLSQIALAMNRLLFSLPWTLPGTFVCSLSCLQKKTKSYFYPHNYSIELSSRLFIQDWSWIFVEETGPWAYLWRVS